MSTDLRIAFRSVRRTPTFFAAMTITLALGIGATAGVLALVNAVLFEALPFADPARLVLIRGEARRESVQPYPLSYLDIRDLAKQRTLFTEVAAVTGTRPFNLTAGADVEHIFGEMSDASYLRALGLRVAAGRWYSDEEAAPPGVPVVVLSHSLWMRRFGGKTDAIGATLLLNDRPYRVIGVAPEGFAGVSDGAHVWLPIGLSGGLYGAHYTEMRVFRWLSAVARLAPEMSATQYQARLDNLSRTLELSLPGENARVAFASQPITEAYFGSLRRPLYALLAGAVLVLLIGCTNVANLMLARGAARRRETGVRVALGASARQVFQPVAAEMIVVGGVAALLGLGIAAAGSRLIVASGAISLASFTNVSIDWLVVSAAVLLSVLCAIIFGAIPVLGTLRSGVLGVLSEGSRTGTPGRGRQRFQRMLVAAEVAVAVILLVGAGLLSRGFSRYLEKDLGFKPDGLLTLRVDLLSDRYKDNAQYFNFTRRLIDQAKAVPGVDAVAIEGPSLPTGGWFQLHATPDRPGAPSFAMRRHHVSAGYFEALGIQRIAGRDFDDAQDLPVGSARNVIISKTLADRAFPNETAVGRRFVADGPQPVPLIVVGIVADVEHSGFQSNSQAQLDMYVAVQQSPARSPAVLTLFVRASGPSGGVMQALGEGLKTIDPNVSFYDVRPMSERLREQTAIGRFLMVLMTLFGTVGLLLAAVGVYGVIAYGVAQRRREIGVRIALGAEGGRVAREIVRDAMVPVGAGALIGLAGVAAGYRLVTSLLYGMSPLDLPTLAGAVGVITATGIIASLVPARRASRIDPAEALRVD